MALMVQKFGGTSVGDPARIRHVARIITDTVDAGHQVVVVVSAMGKTTDDLVSLAKQLIETPSGREYDALLATGEQVSTSLLALTLQGMGYEAIGLSGQQAGIFTESLYNRARILEIQTDVIQAHLASGKIVVVTGFQGVDREGNVTTLGRGGSDTSAVALASALNAYQCHIFTDVPGVFSTDPRLVSEAVKLDRIAYIEMMELARVGAQVLHPRSVETARQANVTLCVRSTFEPSDPGTLIVGVDDMNQDQSVAGIACDEKQVRLALTGVPDKPGIAAEVFGSLAGENISVDMIIQSLHHLVHSPAGENGEVVGTAPVTDETSSKAQVNDIAFTVSQDDLSAALAVLERVKQTVGAKAVLLDTDIAKVSIVGAGMIDRPGIAADMFAALAAAGINIKMITTSEIKISCLVPKTQAKEAVQAIHRCFFSDATTSHEVMVNEKLGY